MTAFEVLDDGGVAVGYDTVSLRSVIELRLREHGLHIIAPAPTERQPPDGYMYVRISTVFNKERNHGASEVHMAFMQEVQLTRPGGKKTYAETWSTGNIAIGPADYLRGWVREQLGNYTDSFINDWLTANPKGAP